MLLYNSSRSSKVLMTKILYILTKDDVGGAQKYVRDLSTHLDPTRFTARICYGGKEIPSLSNRISLPFFLNDWRAIREIYLLLKKEQPDVLHLNSSKAGVLGSLAVVIYKIYLRLNPKPYTLHPRVVFTAHGWVFNPTNALSFFTRFFYRLLHRFSAYFTDAIICVSRYDRRLALCYSIAPVRKLLTIHNGIDPNIPFLSQEEAQKEIIKRLEMRPRRASPRGKNEKLEIDRPWVGSLGRLVKEKNYMTLIEAARLVSDAYFFIIGEGYEIEKLKAQIVNYKLQNRVFLVPSKENDRLLLRAFDVFVLPSIKEGLPYTLLEAMAAGVSSIVTDVGGMPEVTRHCSLATTVPMRNAEALATQIRNVLERKMSVVSCVPFTLHDMVAKTEVVYATTPLPGQQAIS